jgi:hypothetical protein
MNTIHGEMKMFSTTIAQSTQSVQSKISLVYEYSLVVLNPEDNDTQLLNAAFSSLPSLEDWQNWLSGWNSCGYSLLAKPQLIRTI